LQGGSLDKYLNEESRDHDWPTCYNIIKGTCEGLNFLHRGCEQQILHLDLKPANILIDKNMGAKVADFGLSRIFGETHTHTITTTACTAVYMPPEFLKDKQVSPKTDVYSLGVVIIEILAGRSGYWQFCEMVDATPLIEMVITNWRGWINAATSPCPSAELDQVETCIKIAIKCVDHERKNRPTVAEVLDILQEKEHAAFLMGQSLPSPTKSGPRGGSGGIARDIKEKPWRLASLTICYGGLINAFSFSYIDQSGKKQHVGPWGKEYSNKKTEKICFGPSEFVEEVSGACGSYLEKNFVISLTFVTNVRTYGPFGNPYHKDLAATHFRFMADEGSIVGFHGRSGNHLFSIGVYMYPSNKTTSTALSMPVILEGQCLPSPTKSEPWGGTGGTARDIDEKPWRLTSITVSYKGLIDAFSFSYIDQAGKKQSVGPWGEGFHYDITETIRFGPSEFVNELSGAYGNHHGNVIVKFITIVTNVRTYGPFGTPDHPGPDVSATHFRFIADEGSSIVGFYGRSGRYIDAIGFYTARVAEM